MKAFLMYRDRDLDLKAPFPAHAPALAQDLDLETLFEAMSLGDEFLSDVAGPLFLQASQMPKPFATGRAFSRIAWKRRSDPQHVRACGGSA
ncbi:MAG: hypothetical protein WCF79_20755 [Rhodomicrobium sp.]